mgnify:CR=1 FL=1
MSCDHGRTDKYVHEFIGWNMRLDAIQANIMNKLTKKKQSSQNKLFETLDTKISKFYLNDHQVGIIDTVGFINNIPTQLIESFHATLEEITSANFIRLESVGGSIFVLE